MCVNCTDQVVQGAHAEYPATRNRTRDHLIAAEVYNQILYQLSYSRIGRSSVFQAIAQQACYPGFTLYVIYACVCVCPGHCFAEEGDPGINNTRLCCSGPSFCGGGPETKHPRVIYSGLCFQRGGTPETKHPRVIYPGHGFGAGGGESRKPRNICQGIGGAGRGSLEYLHQHMKQRVYYRRARLF